MDDSRHAWFRNESLAPGFSVIGISWAIPVSWQGWIALSLYVAAMVATIVLLVPQRWEAALAASLALTAAFLALSVAKGKRVPGPVP